MCACLYVCVCDYTCLSQDRHFEYDIQDYFDEIAVFTQSFLLQCVAVFCSALQCVIVCRNVS